MVSGKLKSQSASWRTGSVSKLDAWNAWGLNCLNRLMFLRFKRLKHFKHFTQNFESSSEWRYANCNRHSWIKFRTGSDESISRRIKVKNFFVLLLNFDFWLLTGYIFPDFCWEESDDNLVTNIGVSDYVSCQFFQKKCWGDFGGCFNLSYSRD